MTNTINTVIAEDVLNRIHIPYRKFDTADGTLFFCTLKNGMIFNLFTGINSMVKLWRFIGWVSEDQAGNRLEYRQPHYPYQTVGLAVTSEGDVTLYTQQTVDDLDDSQEEKIFDMIDRFSKMIESVQNTQE